MDELENHQVLTAFSRRICQVMGVPFDRRMVTLDRFGNCGAAGVPLALSLTAESEQSVAGNKVAVIAGVAGRPKTGGVAGRAGSRFAS